MIGSNSRYEKQSPSIYKYFLGHACARPLRSPGHGGPGTNTGGLEAQSRSETSPVRRPRPRPMPVILIRPKPGPPIPMRLHDLKVDVKVTGNLATTTMRMKFYNGMNRVLEGRFYFPLSRGRTVSRFAMDVRGKLREGVVVERDKGRKVFESIVRKNIDPGLLEWTKGNNFKARIYPIPARGYKTVLIAYEEEIKNNENGFLYRLPLAFRDKVRNFNLKVEVFKQAIRPRLGPENELVNLRFRRWRESYIAEHKKRDYRPNQALVFRVPRTDAYKKVLVEKDARTGEHYFYLHTLPRIYRERKRLPSRVCLAWDASGSGANRDLDRELAILNNYFKKIGDFSLRLIIVRNDVRADKKDFRVRDANWRAVLDRLRLMAYDGGTQLGALDLTKYKCDEVILSSDGVSNFGASEIKTSGAPIITINSSQTAQHSYLDYIARKTGGVYINLNQLTRNQALALMTTRPYSFLRAEVSGRGAVQMYPATPTAVHTDFSLAGKLRGDSTTIKLHFGFGSRVRHTKTITVRRKDAVRAEGLVRRIWAQKKIAELELRPEKNTRAIIDLGKTFSIVTRGTSLIVLDRIQDYVRHRILPPEELRKEYYAALSKIRETKKRKRVAHIETVVVRFNKLRHWYDTKFDKRDRPAPKPLKKSAERRRNDEPTRSIADDRPRPATAGVPRREPRRRPPPNRAKKDKAKGGKPTSGVTLQKWKPDTPYLRVLRKVSTSELYDEYMKQRKKYARSSAFFLDVADLFIERGRKDLALRVLSNIAEMELQNHQLLRILGHRLSQLEYYRLAIFVFDEVLKMRPEEPQSYRDLGLVHSSAGNNQKAVDLLYTVASRKWDGRFPDIELIALTEMNSIISRFPSLNTGRMDKRLIHAMPVDIRVVLNWDADLTDMDLWVTDPNKEKCYYGHKLTYQGGRMSQDFTRGYGPEVYMVKQAKAGEYTVRVNYYGNRQQILAGATTVQMTLFLNYGKPNQVKKVVTLRLKDKKEVVKIGTFKIRMTPDGVK